jgi:hypothetical protein
MWFRAEVQSSCSTSSEGVIEVSRDGLYAGEKCASMLEGSSGWGRRKPRPRFLVGGDAGEGARGRGERREVRGSEDVDETEGERVWVAGLASLHRELRT